MFTHFQQIESHLIEDLEWNKKIKDNFFFKSLISFKDANELASSYFYYAKKVYKNKPCWNMVKTGFRLETIIITGFNTNVLPI